MHHLLTLLIRHQFTPCSRCCSTQPKSHYEILNLKNNCTSNDIRLAFLKLSKKYHPDVKGANNNPQNFVKIYEAYHVLSKPSSRNAYDRNLMAAASYSIRTSNNGPNPSEVQRPWEIRPNYNPNPGPYYGVNGLKKMPNSKIALLLMALGIFGGVFGYVSVKTSVTFSHQLLDEHSHKASSHHAAMKANAEKFGNEEQLRRMAIRMNAKKDDF